MIRTMMLHTLLATAVIAALAFAWQSWGTGVPGDTGGFTVRDDDQ